MVCWGMSYHRAMIKKNMLLKGANSHDELKNPGKLANTDEPLKIRLLLP